MVVQQLRYKGNGLGRVFPPVCSKPTQDALDGDATFEQDVDERTWF